MSKLLNYTALILCCLSFGAGKAQQLPQFTNYAFTGYSFNPAFAGTLQGFEATLIHRTQWQGINDAPRTYALMLHAPAADGKMGFGGMLYTDVAGPSRRTGIHGSYAYHLQVNTEAKLSLGLNFGLLQYTLDGTQITLREQGDRALDNSMQSELMPTAAFGALWHTDRYYAGVSADQLFNNKLELFDGEQEDNRLAVHYYFTAGYNLPLNEDFALEPSLLVKYVTPAPVKVDVSLRGIYRDLVWLGATYRTADAAAVFAGYNIQNYLRIGYSYDIATSDIKAYTDGTHEIFLSVLFGRTPETTEKPLY